MLQQLHQIRPTSRRTARALAAALALTQLAYQTQAQVQPSNLADIRDRVQVLGDIVAPPPPTTVQQECVEAYSIVLNTTEAELDATDLTLCPAPFDSDSGIIGVDGRASACISDKKVDPRHFAEDQQAGQGLWGAIHWRNLHVHPPLDLPGSCRGPSHLHHP